MHFSSFISTIGRPGHAWMESRKLVRVIEYGFLCTGTFFLAAFVAYEVSAFWQSRRDLRAFEQPQDMTGNLAIQRQASSLSPYPVFFNLWSAGRIKSYEQSLGIEKETPIAVLDIDKIHLRVPVFDGTSDLVLNRGAGWIEGTARPGKDGNVAIAGHRDGFFRGLKDLAAGDRIELQTRTEIDSYFVDQISIVTPADVSVLRPQPTSTITLVTCYPFYYVGSAPKRYIVQGTEERRELLAGRP